MNTQLIFLTQSVAPAVIEIILLLLGAALIGFLTAWFYQKSYFTPIIKKLEDEKEQLNRKIDSLNDEITSLKNKIEGLEKSLADKDNEIKELKNQMQAKG